VLNFSENGSETTSDIGGIGILAALLYLFAILLAFLKGVFEQWRNRNKKPKTSTSKPIVCDKEDRELSHEDSEGDGLFFDVPLFPEDFDDET
jgi:hypothetical protein